MDLSSLSDEELVAKFIDSKDRAFFTEVYLRYHQIVLGRAMPILKNEARAEDVAHDIFLKLFFNLHKYKPVKSFKAWFSVFTYNMIFDFLRGLKKDLSTFEFSNDVEGESPSEEDLEDVINKKMLFEIQYEALERILDQIKPKEKLLLLMKYRDDMSIEEISGVLKIGQSAVKMRLKRTKKKVMDIYNNEKVDYAE